MSARRPAVKEHVHDHEDETIPAERRTRNGVATGCCEQFRTDIELSSACSESGAVRAR